LKGKDQVPFAVLQKPGELERLVEKFERVGDYVEARWDQGTKCCGSNLLL